MIRGDRVRCFFLGGLPCVLMSAQNAAKKCQVKKGRLEVAHPGAPAVELQFQVGSPVAGDYYCSFF
jgi:hypothetical protein